MIENMAGFTPDQLQLLGGIVVTFGSGFVVLVWRVAVWKTKLENDVDNLGFMMGTEKGLAKRELKQKRGKNANVSDS